MHGDPMMLLVDADIDRVADIIADPAVENRCPQASIRGNVLRCEGDTKRPVVPASREGKYRQPEWSGRTTSSMVTPSRTRNDTIAFTPLALHRAASPVVTA